MNPIRYNIIDINGRLKWTYEDHKLVTAYYNLYGVEVYRYDKKLQVTYCMLKANDNFSGIESWPIACSGDIGPYLGK